MMTEETCPICGTLSRRTKFTLGTGDRRFHVLICGKCTLEFAAPRPAKEFLDEFYSTYEADEEERVRKYRASSAAMEYVERTEPKRLLAPVLKFVPPPGKLLDVACGNGLQLRAAQDHGYDVTGMDISAAALAVCREVRGIDDDHLIQEFYVDIGGG